MTVATQRSLYNVDLHLAMLTGHDYICLPNTTLNEKLNIKPTAKVPSGRYPTLQYIGIGIGGATSLNQSPGFINSEHSPIDGCLFEHIPFVVKELNDDLNNNDRLKYRMRKEEILPNGKTYACYYLKVIPTIDYDSKFYTITTREGISYIKQLDMNNPEILNPKPKTRVLKYDELEETELITKLCKFKFTLDAKEKKELENVYKLLGIENQLTEIGLFTGLDVDDGRFKEATCCQMMFSFDVKLDMTYELNQLATMEKYIELGGTEALIK